MTALGRTQAFPGMSAMGGKRTLAGVTNSAMTLFIVLAVLGGLWNTFFAAQAPNEVTTLFTGSE
jgi:hypothetical protein